MEENVLILGATSDMAVAIARQLAQEGYSITLAARNTERLSALEGDLRVRFKAMVTCVRFDAVDYSSHREVYESLPEKPDVDSFDFGLLGDQRKAQDDWTHCADMICSTYTGAVSILNVEGIEITRRR